MDCQQCGTDRNLIDHHLGYIPERTIKLCRNCNVRERRHYPKQKRGYYILKAYPHRSSLLVPKKILLRFGEFIEFYSAPVSPIGVIFSPELSQKDLEHGLGIILESLRLKHLTESKAELIKQS